MHSMTWLAVKPSLPFCVVASLFTQYTTCYVYEHIDVDANVLFNTIISSKTMCKHNTVKFNLGL